MPTTFETKIYQALIPLMALAGKMAENMEHMTRTLDADAYRTMVSIDRELDAWYTSLPEELRWKPSNIKRAPGGFFLL